MVGSVARSKIEFQKSYAEAYCYGNNGYVFNNEINEGRVGPQRKCRAIIVYSLCYGYKRL